MFFAAEPAVAEGPGPALGVGGRERAALRPEVWLLLLTLLALALRLTSISRSLFNDESVSLALAQRSFGHMFSLFGYEANGTPYPVILWPLVRIFGEGAALLRVPALLAGVASVPAIYWAALGFARRRGAALLAAALLALNPMAVWYSQFARSYAFVVLAACLAFGALARATEAPSRRGMWALYVGAMALLAYSDLFAPLLVLPAQGLLAWRARWPGLRRLVRALAAAGLLCVPLLIGAIVEHGRRDPLYWLPKLDRGLVELALQEFSGGFSGVSAVRWVTLLAGVALAGGAVTVLWRRRRAGAGGAWPLLVAGAWGVVPPAVLLLLSAKVALFWPRYAIVALPGLCLFAALCADALSRAGRWRTLGWACAGILLLAGGYADARQANHTQQDWPPVMSWLASQRTPGEPLVVDNVLMLPSMGYYDHALRAGDGKLVVWEWRDTPLPADVTVFKDPTSYGRAPDGPPPVALVQSLARAGGGTVWLAIGETLSQEQGPPETMAAVRWLRANCSVQSRESTGILVLRAEGCPR